MRKLSTVTILILALASVPAHGAHSFGWNQVLMNDGSVHDYTTAAESQPYQGPCVAFAFAAAMSMMYKIEHADPTLDTDLSDAWMDYRTWGNPIGAWKDAIEDQPYPEESCGNFPPNCASEPMCHVLGDVQCYVFDDTCYKISAIYSDPPTPPEYVVSQQSSAGIYWLSAGHVDDTLVIQTVEDLKGYIVERGPVVLRIDRSSNILKFRKYSNAKGVAFHAFVVIGWQESEAGIQWLIKDPWKGMAGITYTALNPGIPALWAAGDVAAWQVSEIAYIKKGNVKKPGQSWPDFDPENQCSPPEFVAELSCWDYGDDRGGCLNVPGATGEGLSVSWELFGSGGWLVDDEGFCTEIIGSGFVGTLKGTVTDSCGRTATATCHFPGGR